MNNIDVLIKQCKKGKQTAQQKLYEQFSPQLYFLCLRYLKKEEIAQDILHDGFIKIFEKIVNYSNQGSFEGWMKRIMINESLTFLKNQAISYKIEDIDVKYEEIEQIEYPKAELVDVLNILEDLPIGSRTVFNLFYLEGYTHKEIVKELQISEGTSKSQLARAKKLIKEKVILKKEVYEF